MSDDLIQDILMYGPDRGPLTEHQVRELADYNGRRMKGIVHDESYMARMRKYQDRFNEEMLANNPQPRREPRWMRIFGRDR